MHHKDKNPKFTTRRVPIIIRKSNETTKSSLYFPRTSIGFEGLLTGIKIIKEKAALARVVCVLRGRLFCRPIETLRTRRWKKKAKKKM